MGRHRTGSTRPRDVLPLPATAAPPPSPPPPPPPSRRPGGWLGGALVGAVLLALLLGDPATDAPPELVTDPATEDAVVAVLQLYAAEVAMADTVAADDPFSLPGPAARADALDAAVTTARRVLEALRADDPAPGTPASDYVADGDHDALLALAATVADRAQELAALEEVHATLLTGAAVTTPARATAVVAALRDRAGDPTTRAWAAALAGVLAGQPEAPAAARSGRAAAGAAWQAAADRLAPAALGPLTAFLGGIDPGVLAALDGHPVAGPALRRLRG